MKLKSDFLKKASGLVTLFKKKKKKFPGYDTLKDENFHLRHFFYIL